MSRPDRVSKLIIQVLRQNHALTAPEIVELFHIKGLRYNKTSIYRALERLIEQQALCRNMFGGQTATYELRDHHHDHLVCSKCGKIELIPCLKEIPVELNGWEIDHHHLTLFGLCEHCSGQTEKSDQPPTHQSLSERTK